MEFEFIDLEFLQAELQRIGAASADGKPIRFDAGETAAIAKQLEYVFTRTFDIKYPSLKARQFIPVNNEVPSGAQTYTYRQWDEYGMAEFIANYADDLPNVDATVKEFVAKIESIGDSYQYSVQDLRAAAMSGNQLDSRRAMVARRRIEAKIDDVMATGNAVVGMSGFVNNGNVPLVAPTTGSWASATVAQILADLRKLQRSIITTTKTVHSPDTLLLDTSSFDILANTEISLDNGSNVTILQHFLNTSPYIRNIDQWNKFDLADAAGTGPRIVMYERSPEVVEMIIPQEFESFPPQARNLAFVVPCHARVGGVSWRYPLAAAYMDGV
jgi:hypothetical protein